MNKHSFTELIDGNVILMTNKFEQKDISFTVGITTFNREIELKKNLHSISKVQDGLIEAVYIVNQGQPLSFDIKDISSKFILIEQDNLGGSGGFCRTMYCSLHALNCQNKPTHQIIMDDDAFAQPCIFEYAAKFASEQPDLCLGGHMRLLEDPRTIAELGVNISPNGHWSSIGDRLNLDSIEAREMLEKPQQVDAHAWWFWIVPLKAIRKLGLPLPFFIKGDDIEYSYRCKEAGFPTYYVPQLHIEHPSIRQKGSNWRYYYLARNNAIFSACRDSVNLPKHYAFFRILAALLRHEYYRARLEMRGIEDFLGGPELWHKNSSAEIHSKLIEYEKNLVSPERLPKQTSLSIESGPMQKRRYALAAILAPFYKNSRNVAFSCKGSNPVDPIKCLGACYEVPLSGSESVEVFQFDRKQYLSLFFKMLPLAARFFLKSGDIAIEWKEAQATFISEAYWKEQFKIGDE